MWEILELSPTRTPNPPTAKFDRTSNGGRAPRVQTPGRAIRSVAGFLRFLTLKTAQDTKLNCGDK